MSECRQTQKGEFDILRTEIDSTLCVVSGLRASLSLRYSSGQLPCFRYSE